MCTLCTQLQTFHTQCNFSDNTLYAALSESGDAAGNTSTNAAMSVGDSFSGNLSFSGDADWVAITLEAGATYEINLIGGTLVDPYLQLFDASGNYITFDDDSYGGLDSSLSYTATTSGTYYLSARDYSFTYTGSYTLSVVQASAPVPLEVVSLETLADYLTDGYWEDNGGTRRSFDTDISNTISVNLNGLTTEGQQLARWAFETWEAIADIEFVESSSFFADIRFQDHDSGAYSSSVVFGDDISSSIVNVSTEWLDFYGTTIDSYSLSTYIHEIGHALGLGHQGNYNGTGTFATSASFANDSLQLSIMSYFDPSENPNVNASSTDLLTPMMADILAIQNLYGAADDTSASAGDSVWGANTNMTGYWAYLEDILAGNTIPGTYTGGAVSLTISDQGGIDTLDLSTSTSNDTISLIDETFSDVGGLIGNLGIAQGTSIENLEAGSGNDVITGSAIANVINSNSGHDTVEGGAGDDVILGGVGNDLVAGGLDDDVINGMDGFDTLRGEDGDDTIFGGGWGDRLEGGAGNDSLSGDNGNDEIFADDGDDVISGGFHNDTVYAGDGDDLAFGDDGDDVIDGGAGDDTLQGGFGEDQLSGDGGNDLVFGQAGNDFLAGSNGFDTIWGGTGIDTISGGGWADTLGGAAGNDVISGDNGNDLIWGGDNNDWIDGGSHNDTLRGGSHNDTILGGDGNDDINGGWGWDNLNGGDGNDFVHGFNGNDVARGGSGNDIILGGFGDDTIMGDAGSDTIYGGSGNDMITGGEGADRFVFGFTPGSDVITDFNAAQGDVLRIDDVLWSDTHGVLTREQVISTFATVENGALTFNFDTDEQLVLNGITVLDDGLQIF